MTDQPAAAPTPERWGIMNDGPIGDGKPWTAYGEAAPGLTICSTHNTEPVCRVLGYLQPVEAYAALIAAAPETAAERDRLKVVNEGLVALLRDALPHVEGVANALTIMTGPVVGPVDRLASEISAALAEAHKP